MLNYATTLTSMTQGRATYTMEYSHYDYVPSEIAEKVIAAARAARGVVVEEEEQV
jgi:elongation factor G